MGKVIYAFNVSVDGYIESAEHSLDWADVDDEVHAWFNDRARGMDAFLYGRRLYETMAAFWPQAESHPEANAVIRDFARIWNAKPKVVFSRSLATVGEGCRLVRGDVGEELAALRREFDGDLDVGGAALGAAFLERGLVDELGLVVHPVVLGGGTPFLPRLADRIPLRRSGIHAFGNGAAYLGYEVVR